MLDFPIRTPRLLLEPLTSVDRDAFVAYRRDPEVARWQSWTPEYDSTDADALLAAQGEALRLRPGDWLQIAVRALASGGLLGDVAVHVQDEQPDTYEVGVMVAPLGPASP